VPAGAGLDIRRLRIAAGPEGRQGVENLPDVRRAEVLQPFRIYNSHRRGRGDAIANDARAGDGDLIERRGFFLRGQSAVRRENACRARQKDEQRPAVAQHRSATVLPPL